MKFLYTFSVVTIMFYSGGAWAEMPLPPQPEMQQYIQKDSIHSLTYPGNWGYEVVEEKGQPVAIFKPADSNGDVVCRTSVEGRVIPASYSQNNLVTGAVRAKSFERGVIARNSGARNFTTSKFNIVDGVAVRMVYDDVARGGAGKGRDVVTAQVVTYNVSTGHMVDMTCIAYKDAWSAEMAAVVERMQASLTLHKKGEVVKIVKAVAQEPAAPDLAFDPVETLPDITSTVESGPSAPAATP